MKIKLLLRIASIIMLLHVFGHMSGHLTWKQTTNPVKQAVVNQMTQHKFSFMGAERSLGEYYDGYGYAAAIAMLFIVYLLWTLSGITDKKHGDIVKRILMAVSVFLFAWGIDELLFFFPFAALFSLVAGALTTTSFIFIQKHGEI